MPDFLHLPDNLMSSNDVPVCTASGKAHNYVPNCSSCYFSISVQSADDLKGRKQVRKLRVAHLNALIFVSLNFRWNFSGLNGSSYIKPFLFVFLFKLRFWNDCITSSH